MKTTIRNVKKLFVFENEKGFEVTIESFEDGLAVIEIPVDVDVVPEEGRIYFKIVYEDEYVSFMSGAFNKDSNFKDELLRVYGCDQKEKFVGFKLQIQELVYCTVTKEDSSALTIRENMRIMVYNFANEIMNEANREISEYDKKFKLLNDILGRTELRFKNYRAEAEYEENLQGMDIDEIGFAEDFVTYVQYLIRQKKFNVPEAVQETYKFFDSINVIEVGSLPILRFICHYCLYGEEIIKSYFDIQMQKFNDELNTL